MNLASKTLATFALAMAPFASAQTSHSYFSTDSNDSSQHSYLFVSHSTGETEAGSMVSSAKFHEYADSHEGTYVLFTDGGNVYRLDAPGTLAEVERLYAPMKDLQEQQKAFAEKQKPLAGQQKELSAKMRAANGKTDEMRRIGEQMGEVGRQQGALGREQGALGRKQGEIGRAVHNYLEAAIDACLKDGSCMPVAAQ